MEVKKKMLGKLVVERRRSKKGSLYDCVVFYPDEMDGKSIILTFDKLIAYRLADLEGVSYEDFVQDEV